MPYIMVEELPEGVEAADVVERTEYDALSSRLSDAEGQRDRLLERAETLTSELSESRKKYADAFLGAAQAQPPKEPEQEPDPEPKHKTSFKQLFV